MKNFLLISLAFSLCLLTGRSVQAGDMSVKTRGSSVKTSDMSVQSASLSVQTSKKLAEPPSLQTNDSSIKTLSHLKPLSGGVSQQAIGFSDDTDFAEAQVKASPEDPEAWFLLAVAYSRTPYVERALEGLEKAKRLARKHPEGFGIFDRKIAEYEQMRAKTPDDTLLLYRLGFGYYMRGYAVEHQYIRNSAQPAAFYYDKAEDSFRQLLKVNPGDFMTMNYLGYLLAERDPAGNYDQAVALWQDSLKVNADNPGAYMLLGQAAMKQGKLREAVELSVKALNARNAWLEAHQINPDTVKVRL